MQKGNGRLPGDLLGRWTRLVARLEAIEQEKQAHGDWLDIDWSDLVVLNAYLTEDAEFAKWQGSENTTTTTQRTAQEDTCRT